MPTAMHPGIATPSVIGRAITTLLLLAGFYVLTLGLAVVLLATPLAYLYFTVPHDGFKPRVALLLFAVCWLPALTLLTGVIGVRRARCRVEGMPIERAQAPELFALLDDLAARASVELPHTVYLTSDPNVGVMEVNGARVLVIGIPVLAWATVDELRACLAHEFGHFAFGDTKLLGLVEWAHAAFRSVLESTQRARSSPVQSGTIEIGLAAARALGEGVVCRYAQLYFWITRKADRRAELAADALAARLVGPAPLVRLLEKAAVLAPLFDAYRDDVRRTIHAGFLPTDLLAGFEAFTRNAEALGHLHALAEAARTRDAKPYDSHPTNAIRFAALASMPEPSRLEDARLAAALFRLDLDRYLGDHLASHRAPRRLPWAEVPRALYAPTIAAAARELAAALFSRFPEARTQAAMFAAYVQELAAGRTPTLPFAPSSVLRTLFQGALLEAGAELEPSLGLPGFVFRYRDTRVIPALLVAACFEDDRARHAVEAWAAALSQPPASRAPTDPSSALGGSDALAVLG